MRFAQDAHQHPTGISKIPASNHAADGEPPDDPILCFLFHFSPVDTLSQFLAWLEIRAIRAYHVNRLPRFWVPPDAWRVVAQIEGTKAANLDAIPRGQGFFYCREDSVVAVGFERLVSHVSTSPGGHG